MTSNAWNPTSKDSLCLEANLRCNWTRRLRTTDVHATEINLGVMNTSSKYSTQHAAWISSDSVNFRHLTLPPYLSPLLAIPIRLGFSSALSVSQLEPESSKVAQEMRHQFCFYLTLTSVEILGISTSWLKRTNGWNNEWASAAISHNDKRRNSAPASLQPIGTSPI